MHKRPHSLQSCSTSLYQFYLAWYTWVCDFAPEGHPIFRRDRGLCTASEDFEKVTFPGFTEPRLVNEMKHRFAMAGLSRFYPFDGFSDDIALKSMHMNPERCQWVREELRNYQIRKEMEDDA